ncbi:MAG: DUF5686 family protein [Bacteroidaceae bacterium]
MSTKKDSAHDKNRVSHASSIFYRNKVLSVTDSVINEAQKRAVLYRDQVKEFTAQTYLKGTVELNKRNIFLKYVPFMFDLQKKENFYVMESVSDLHYTHPDLYDQKMIAAQGTVKAGNVYASTMMRHLKVQIYDDYLMDGQVLSPIGKKASNYYHYHLDSIFRTQGQIAYKISFSPVNSSYQLAKGYLVISGKSWSVRELYFKAKTDFFEISNMVNYGELGTKKEYLPTDFDVWVTFRFLGNKVYGSYTAKMDYKTIDVNPYLSCDIPNREKLELDMSKAYTLSLERSDICMDSAQFAKYRPIPLNSVEIACYQRNRSLVDSLQLCPEFKTKNVNFWGEMSDRLLRSYTFDWKKSGSLKGSALFNPFYLSYDGKNGLSYKQRFKYNRIFAGDRLLRVSPKVGYNFTHKEFYWDIYSEFYYAPKWNAAILMELGWGNRIYNSQLVDMLRESSGDTFDWDQINLSTFEDRHISLLHEIEPVNGFKIAVGFIGHNRSEIKKTKLVIAADDEKTDSSTEPYDPEVISKLHHSYCSFSPRIRLKWIPYQHYYYDGNRKVNLDSNSPTFTLDWERAVPGVFNCSMQYERWEFDVQQRLRVAPLTDLYYRVGAGVYTNQKSTYFADFLYFSKNNLPSGWNDDISGDFYQLNRSDFNSSNKYLRANLTYQSPFLLFNRLFPKRGFTLSERLYYGVLYTPLMSPYSELGYGMATSLFDMGFFVGFEKTKFQSCGVKFTFELFSR